MRREIKFRVWQDNCYIYSENCRNGLESFFGLFDLEEKGVVLEQYTVLKDKNEKEIYEGDFVIEGKYTAKEVEFLEEGFDPFIYSGGGEFSPSKCEIVGNIHEHPELLNN